jgi:hypothetical protein
MAANEAELRAKLSSTALSRDLYSRRQQTSSGLFAVAKTAFSTIFHRPDMEATQYGMTKWNKPVRLQLYS